MIRRGRARSGTRHTREIKEDRQTVPRSVEKVCDTAARTTVFDGVFGGIEWRWKYHCDTVAAVVALTSIPNLRFNTSEYRKTRPKSIET